MVTLEQLAPPPANPVHAGGNWDSVADQTFPGDYRRLIERYGLGCFANFVVLRNPFAPAACCWPELEEGLFVWATTGNGDRIGWRRGGESPDEWSVGVRASREDDVTYYEMTATEFLTQWLDGRLKVAAFPERDVYFDPTFERTQARRFIDLFVRLVEGPFEGHLQMLFQACGGLRMRGLYVKEHFRTGSFVCDPELTRVHLRDIDGDTAGLGLGFVLDHESVVKEKIAHALRSLGWSVTRVRVRNSKAPTEAILWQDLVSTAAPRINR